MHLTSLTRSLYRRDTLRYSKVLEGMDNALNRLLTINAEFTMNTSLVCQKHQNLGSLLLRQILFSDESRFYVMSSEGR